MPEDDPGQPEPLMEARIQGLEKAVGSLQVGAAEQKTLSQQLLEQGKQTQEMVRVMTASKAAPDPSPKVVTGTDGRVRADIDCWTCNSHGHFAGKCPSKGGSHHSGRSSRMSASKQGVVPSICALGMGALDTQDCLGLDVVAQYGSLEQLRAWYRDGTPTNLGRWGDVNDIVPPAHASGTNHRFLAHADAKYLGIEQKITMNFIDECKTSSKPNQGLGAGAYSTLSAESGALQLAAQDRRRS